MQSEEVISEMEQQADHKGEHLHEDEIYSQEM